LGNVATWQGRYGEARLLLEQVVQEAQPAYALESL
jgi:hypothetical protein